jgi:hypothetical protein
VALQHDRRGDEEREDRGRHFGQRHEAIEARVRLWCVVHHAERWSNLDAGAFAGFSGLNHRRRATRCAWIGRLSL